MHWHVENDVKIGYRDRTVTIPNSEVRFFTLDQEDEIFEEPNLSVKKFRSLICKKKDSNSLQ